MIYLLTIEKDIIQKQNLRNQDIKKATKLIGYSIINLFLDR